MNTLSDQKLLADYAARRSEAAFAELVRRHVDLVYSAALRMVRDAHLAEDVTQHVFTALAQNAGQLTDRAVLSGWLHRTAQNIAANTVRSEVRRRAREQEAVLMNEILSADSDVSWQQIAPHLDTALGELSEADRDAVLLRYFEKKSAQEMAERLGLSPEAAQKRVNRAVEKLRDIFSKRKITIGAAGLVVLLSANAVQSAPVALAATISTAALAGTAVTTSTLIAATKTIAMTTFQKAFVTATIAVIAGAGIYKARQAEQLRDEVRALRQQQSTLTQQLRLSQNERDAATNRWAAMAEELAAIKKSPDEVLKLRGEVGRLQSEKSEAKAPITHDMVEARYKNAQELARNGDSADALREFLWCFDEGMPQVPSYTGVRASFLLGSIAELGETYPAALDALRDRRDKALQRMLNGADDSEAAMDFVALNGALKEDGKTLTAFDQLPADDSRRQTLAMVAYSQLVQAQRYGDASQGKPYTLMNAEFDMGDVEFPMPADTAEAERIRKNQRDYLISSTTMNVEVLAGAGDLEHARLLAGRLLEYDPSPETRALLQQHAARAGKPDLLGSLANH